jgi:glucose-1-phosphate thymidylyltransferase
VVLETIKRRIGGDIDDTSAVIGHVIVEEGAIIRRSVVRGPAVIGAGTVLENVFVGPFTTIGNNCALENCEIEHSIVLEKSHIRNVGPRINDSLIGKEVLIERRDEMPRSLRFMLGDHSQVGIL